MPSKDFIVYRRLAGFGSRRFFMGRRKSLAGAKKLAERTVGYGTYCTVEQGDEVVASINMYDRG